MIPLNSPQGLPRNALWYLALRSLAGVIFLVLIGGLFHADSSHAVCRGLLCGMVSGGQVSVFMYLLAAILMVRAVLTFKWFSFVLTDKSISINSGVLFQNSCTIRFDRIQDIDLVRNPLHLLLGLKSVAIWTASPDQRVGNSKRPDGLLLLDAESADWLKEYLSDPPAASGAAPPAGIARRPAVTSDARHATGAGLALILTVAVLMALAVVGILKKSTVTVPAAASAPAMASAPAAASAATTASIPAASTVPATSAPATASAPGAAGRNEALASAANRQTVPATYAVACAIHDSSGNVVTLCADLAEARRCGHESEFASRPTQQPAELSIVNRSDEEIKFFWLDPSGTRALYATLPPGGHVRQQSHLGAHWLVSTHDGQCVGIFNAATMTVGIF